MQLVKYLCLFIVISLAACAQQRLTVDDAPVLTLVHLNDTYRIDAVEDGQRGGFGRVVTLLEEYGQDGRDVRLMHGGDFLYPSLESQLWNGQQMIEAFNFMDAIAPMVVVPGNHEFDRRSPDALIDAVNQSNIDWVGDNLRFMTGNQAVDQRMQHRYVMEAGGLRIGVLGLTLHARDDGNARDYIEIDRNYVAVAERTLAYFEAQSVDLVIGLTHLHLDLDRKIAALKAKYPKLMLVAGGHEHEPEFEAGDTTRATIVKGASNARTVWAIDVYRDQEGQVELQTRRIAIDERISSDSEYGEITDRWRRQLLEKIPFLEAQLGEAAVPLDSRETAVRNEESNWGVFIADQMRGAFGEPAQLAFVNGGTLRIDDYIIGDITFEDVGRTFGFSSFLRQMKINGADFKTLLEAGYRGTGPSKGYFPQISGFRVCVDRSRPNGQRIVSLQVPADAGWQEIDPDTEYTLVAPDYLYRGGDGYVFDAATDVSPAGSELKYLVVDAIIRAQAQEQQVGRATDPDNLRIVILGKDRTTCW
ncbi:MAG: 5'-nucleotidase C-terminal domain-containing protein [Woeseia sp.]|nr:5'-nucleotidase C-terminal domain-containing protein [Woeseia sp.]